MKLKSQEKTLSTPSKTIFDKIRNLGLTKYIAATLSLATIWATAWLSSCKDKQEKTYQELSLNIIPKDHKVDISTWDKIIYQEWNSLKIWDETVATRNKLCSIWIEYENSERYENLIWAFLEKPWKIIIHIIPLDTPDIPDIPKITEKKKYDERMKKYNKKYEERVKKNERIDYIILVTNQDSMISWLDDLKNISFKVWESINIMNYISLNNVILKKATIKYPNKQELEINPYNFIPEYEWQWSYLKIYVIKKWKTYKGVAEINILPKNREPIWPTIERSRMDGFPPLTHKNMHDDNTYQYIQESNAAVWWKMIQVMTHYWTTTRTAKEYNTQQNKVTYIIVKEKKDWNKETTKEWQKEDTHQEESIDRDIIKEWIKNSEFITIIDEENNPYQSKITKYALSHPEETIVICEWSSDRDDNNTTNKPKNSVEIHNSYWLDNVIELNTTWTDEYKNLNKILVWLCATLNKTTKDSSDKPQRNYILNWERIQNSIVNIWWYINKILPTNLSLKIDFSHTNNWKYELKKWEYPLIIFDIPWAMMKINWEWIPCNKWNWYILKETNISACERCIDKDELLKLWYKPWSHIKWNIITLDKNGKKLDITIPIIIEVIGL